jgi:hypothetical protein
MGAGLMEFAGVASKFITERYKMSTAKITVRNKFNFLNSQPHNRLDIKSLNARRACVLMQYGSTARGHGCG